MQLIYQWIDLLWFPLAWFAVHKGQRWITFVFLAACSLMLRMQAELMSDIDRSHGILQFLGGDAFQRGLFVYGLFIMVFLVLTHYSPNTRGFIMIGAALSMFIMAFIASMIIMVF